ncbi:MAG: argininosuccinate lyase [Thermodesulfobacteriota bacterium]
MKKSKRQKAWAGRFSKPVHKLTDELNASIGFDLRLFRHDIRGSIAHALILAEAGVITKSESKKIISGLKGVEKDIASGAFRPGVELEDIHMAVESRLIKKIGALGGKLHTGRSRNDQVALDIRLFLKEEINAVLGLLVELKKTLVGLAEKNIDCVMPGYTHLQRAQPVLFSHHLLAYYEMFGRDSARLNDCLKRVDVLPLGAGALAGSPYKLNRRLAARLLGFSAVTVNSMDSVSDRDFIIEFLSAAAIIAMHLSRLSEELIIWSSSEFGFVEIPDEFATGSSIMPQKKNPDIAELARGKTGRVYGSLMAMLTVMKALPLAYNKDMQEDKEPLFDTVDTVKNLLRVFSPMLKGLKINGTRMSEAAEGGFLNATDAADYLTKKGLPFREAHRVVGEIVARCINKGVTLQDMTLAEWKGFSPLFGPDIKKTVSIKNSVNSRTVPGGTSTANVKRRIRKILSGELD